ncbi:hypothetical protein EMPS_02282 [Entomortierella parvispora]|uniref:DUF3020 domain-containing protein n=1 Tax=Entomortierella parvispora TaxID=205924 RepID=A0A9P3H4I1_9FUNG|nr:hypothetical protein EMPS_02282 [Entomortierella parvispora]
MIRDESAFEAQVALDSIAAVSAAVSALPSHITTVAHMTNSTTPPAGPPEPRKKEVSSEKVRIENRERKKRWREQNEERNKDNDLRCRVNKRANKMLGNVDSEIKARWIEEEFAKRQWKRKDKERRKNPDASSLEPMPPPVSTISLSEQIAIHQQQQQQQQQQHSETHQQQLAQLQHAFDPKTALALNDLVKTTTSHLDLAQITGVLTDPDLTRQLLEMNANNPQSQSATSLMVLTAPAKPEDQDKGRVMDAEYPMDAVLTLMQLNGSWKG